MIAVLKRNRWKLVRRSVQVTVIFLLLTPALGFTFFHGTLVSGELFGITLIDPLAAADHFLAARTISLAIVVGALIVLAFYFVVGGRVFCSWVCPIHLVHEMADRLRRRFGLFTLKPSTHQRFWVLAIVLILSLVMATPAFEIVSPIAAVSQSIAVAVQTGAGAFGSDAALRSTAAYGGTGGLILTSPGDGWQLLWSSSLLIVLFIFLMDVFVTKAWWCKYTCPVGAVYSIVGRWSPSRVRIDRRACDRCAKCYQVCMVPEVLTPPVTGESGWVLSGDCSNCLNCVDACPGGALGLHFSLFGRK